MLTDSATLYQKSFSETRGLVLFNQRAELCVLFMQIVFLPNKHGFKVGLDQTAAVPDVLSSFQLVACEHPNLDV